MALDLGRRAMALYAERPNAWSGAAAAGQLGATLLETGERGQAVEVLTRGRSLAEEQGSESYLLRCLAPLAEATGSAQLIDQATAMLTRISAPPGSAWMGGAGAYLAVARAWLDRGEPARARAVLAPMLSVAGRVPWVGPLAEGSLVDGRASMTLGRVDEARSFLTRAADVAGRYGLVATDAAAVAELRRIS
jgi:hypothetical protein